MAFAIQFHQFASNLGGQEAAGRPVRGGGLAG